MSSVGLMTVAGTVIPPIVTVAPGKKPVPVTVTIVPGITTTGVTSVIVIVDPEVIVKINDSNSLIFLTNRFSNLTFPFSQQQSSLLTLTHTFSKTVTVTMAG